MPIPSGTESARPFLPTKDFKTSKAFYESLGFKKLLDGDVAIFAAGQTAFILQRLYDESWVKFTMMQLMVDDLDQWWRHIELLDLPTKFGVQPAKPPAIQPWGLRVAYLYDPAGILWHVAQRRENAPSD